jgi:hypothetical protein
MSLGSHMQCRGNTACSVLLILCPLLLTLVSSVTAASQYDFDWKSFDFKDTSFYLPTLEEIAQRFSHISKSGITKYGMHVYKHLLKHPARNLDLQAAVFAILPPYLIWRVVLSYCTRRQGVTQREVACRPRYGKGDSNLAVQGSC